MKIIVATMVWLWFYTSQTNLMEDKKEENVYSNCTDFYKIGLFSILYS